MSKHRGEPSENEMMGGLYGRHTDFTRLTINNNHIARGQDLQIGYVYSAGQPCLVNRCNTEPEFVILYPDSNGQTRRVVICHAHLRREIAFKRLLVQEVLSDV